MWIKPVYAPPEDTGSAAGNGADPGAGGAGVETPNTSTDPGTTGAENFVVDMVRQAEHLRGSNFDSLDDIDLPPVGVDGVQGTSEPGQEAFQRQQGQPSDDATAPPVEFQWPQATPQGHQTQRPPAGTPGQPQVGTPPAGQQPQVPGQQAGQQQPQGQQDPATGVQAPEVTRAESPVDPFAQAQQLIAQSRDQFMEVLSDKMYPITDEEVRGLLDEPGGGKKISQYLAAVQLNTVDSVMRVVSQQMPVWLNGLLSVRTMYHERENQFWTANPHLDRKQHRQYIAPIANAYRASNPQADDATIDRMVGMLISAQLGLPIQGYVPQQQGNGQARAAPAGQPPPQRQTGHQMPPVRTPGPVVRSVRPSTYAPAGAGGVGHQPGQQQPQRNQWDTLAEAFQMDDAGAFDHLPR
jgi:hypothetical protein